MEKNLMRHDSTNWDNSFWGTIGTQTMTRDPIFRFGTQFWPFGTIWDNIHGLSPIHKQTQCKSEQSLHYKSEHAIIVSHSSFYS